MTASVLMPARHPDPIRTDDERFMRMALALGARHLGLTATIRPSLESFRESGLV